LPRLKGQGCTTTSGRPGQHDIWTTGQASRSTGRRSPRGQFLADILGPGLIAGAGLGLVFAPLFVAAATGVSWQQAGLATGLVNTSQQRGSALGLAIPSSVALAQINQHTTATPEAPPAATPPPSSAPPSSDCS